MQKKLLISLLVYFPIFGLRTIGRNTPLVKVEQKPSSVQPKQLKTVKRAPQTDKEIKNMHMSQRITPPDRHQMTQGFAHKELEDVFAEIYHTNYWLGDISRSGQGSSLASTKVIRNEIAVLCDALQAKTILDIGCGDFYWMQTVNVPDCAYIGIDVVPEMIELNRSQFGDNKHHFLCLNAARDPLPQADMVICRDVLAHLNYKDACNLLRNIKASGSKFLLMSTHLDTQKNHEKHTGHHMAYNVTLAPFYMPSPLVLIEETTAEEETRKQRKAIGLWLLDDINVDCLDC